MELDGIIEWIGHLHFLGRNYFFKKSDGFAWWARKKEKKRKFSLLTVREDPPPPPHTHTLSLSICLFCLSDMAFKWDSHFCSQKGHQKKRGGKKRAEERKKEGGGCFIGLMFFLYHTITQVWKKQEITNAVVCPFCFFWTIPRRSKQIRQSKNTMLAPNIVPAVLSLPCCANAVSSVEN